MSETAVKRRSEKYKIGFLEIFIPFYSIIMYYTFPFGGSVGQFMFLIYFILTFPRHLMKNKPHIPKGLLVFVILLLPLQALAFGLYGGFDVQRLINLIMIFFYTAFLGFYDINLKGLIKIYKIVAVLASIAIIYHFILINVFGRQVEAILLLPVERPEGWYQEGIRPMGLFPEPQVYATFILPLLVMTVQNKERLMSLFLTFCIALSTSSLGIFCALGIWMYFTVSAKMNKLLIVASLVLFGIVVYIASTLSIFEYAVEKIATTDFEENSRLTRGFYIYSLLPPIHQIIGIGVNNVEYALESGKLFVDDNLTVLMKNPAYMTTTAELLVKYGLILTLVYFGMLWNFFKNSKCKILVLLLFFLSFGQTILFSGVWLVFMIFIQATLKEGNNCFWTGFGGRRTE